MARPRKPTKLKILHGDFEKNPKRRPKLEPELPEGQPRCPSGFSAEAKSEWKRVIKELTAMRVLTVQDRAAVEQYCEIWGRWKRCIRTVDKEGMVVTGATGPTEHPCSRMARAYSDQIHKYLCQFGLTPASRSRVNVTEATKPMRMRRVR